MTLSLAVALRNTRLDAITTALNGGTGSPNRGILRIYNGSRPANADAALSSVSPTPTLLAELRFAATSFPAASSGTMTANTIADDSSANATGTATWFRVLDSDGTAILDGTCGDGSPVQDMNLNTTSIQSGAVVSCTSFVLTEGNP